MISNTNGAYKAPKPKPRPQILRVVIFCPAHMEVEVPSATSERHYRVTWKDGLLPRCNCPGFQGHCHCYHTALASSFLFSIDGLWQSKELVEAQLAALPLPANDDPAIFHYRSVQALLNNVDAAIDEIEPPEEKHPFAYYRDYLSDALAKEGPVVAMEESQGIFRMRVAPNAGVVCGL